MTTMDKLFQWIAWMLPPRLVYWCGLRIGAHATTGRYSSTVAPEFTFVTAMARWDLDKLQGQGSAPALKEEG